MIGASQSSIKLDRSMTKKHDITCEGGERDEAEEGVFRMLIENPYIEEWTTR